MEILFEWDEEKAQSNFRKHGIRFEEAVYAFVDPYAIVEQDRIENGEQRWQTLGTVRGFLLLVVAHTVRFEDDPAREVIRIISARQADRKERRRYEHG